MSERVAIAEAPTDLIELGRIAQHLSFGISLQKLLDGRLLIQGQSGAGKSWLLRRLLEQSSGLIQHVVIDAEGEFRSLAESADYPLIDAGSLDGRGFATLGRRVRERRLSIVFDVSQLEREAQMSAVCGLLRAMIDCPREHWHPALVVIDEAHLFAPFGASGVESSETRRAVTATVVDLMSRGRKRGLACALATQRLTRLSKSVASEATNFLIGHNTLDLDIRRAAAIAGWDTKRALEHLPRLTAGKFVATGHAFTVSHALVTIGGVRSSHLGSTPMLSAPPLPSAEEAHALLSDAGEDRDYAAPDHGVPRRMRAVRDFIANRAAPLAIRVFAELKPLYPDGAVISELQEHLGASDVDLRAAFELLETYNAVTVRDGACRIERSMAARIAC